MMMENTKKKKKDQARTEITAHKKNKASFSCSLFHPLKTRSRMSI